jgi:SAM-dependent methyltransferase
LVDAEVTMQREPQWEIMARRWAMIGWPMRPTPADVAYYEAWAAKAATALPLRAVLLGVTPEIALMQWPKDTRLTAVDRSEAMLAAVWPRDRVSVDARTMLSGWDALPLDAGSQDIVIGDGCYTVAAPLDVQERITREVHRVLKPTGTFIMRLFVAESQPGAVAALFDDLWAGRFAHFQEFKLLLLTRLPRDRDEIVQIADVWNAWDAAGIDRKALSERLGWSPAMIDTIDAYRDSAELYCFASPERMIERFAPHFDMSEIKVHDYALASNCPTLVLRPRSS